MMDILTYGGGSIWHRKEIKTKSIKKALAIVKDIIIKKEGVIVVELMHNDKLIHWWSLDSYSISFYEKKYPSIKRIEVPEIRGRELASKLGI